MAVDPINREQQHSVPPSDKEDAVEGLGAAAPSVSSRPHVQRAPPPVSRADRASRPSAAAPHSRIPFTGTGRIPVGVVPVSKAESRVEESEHVDSRSGPVTGAKIVRLLTRKPMSPGQIAKHLDMEESYIRRVCRQLHDVGVLAVNTAPQRGTPPVRLYSIVPLPNGNKPS